MADAKDLLTSPQVGVILGKSARTVSRLAQTGELPYESRLDVGNGVYLFERKAVEDYAAQRNAEKTA